MCQIKTSCIPSLHRLLKHTTKLCTKYTVESSITSRKELAPLTFIETQLRYLLSKKIIALVLDTLVLLNHQNKFFSVKLFALALAVLQVSADGYFSS